MSRSARGKCVEIHCNYVVDAWVGVDNDGRPVARRHGREQDRGSRILSYRCREAAELISSSRWGALVV